MVDSVDVDLAEVIDSVDLPIVVVCCDTTIARFNAAAAKRLALTSSEIGLSLHQIAELAGIAHDLEELCEYVVGGGSAAQREVRVRDGSWFVVRIVPYFKADRRVAGAVLTFTNVTVLRASVERAIHEREYTKAILNAIGSPVVVLDADLRVQTANKPFYNMFQVSREDTQSVLLENLGRGHWDIARVRRLLRATLSAADSEVEGFELEHELPAIGRRTLRLNARRLSRGGNQPPMILLTIEDVTDVRRAEETRARLGAIVASSDDAIVGKTLDGFITDWNPGAERIFGYTAAEAVGQHITLIIPEERRAEEDGVLARLRRGEKIDHFETVRRTKDGRKINVSLTVSPIKDDDGRIIGASKVARDITDRKRSEAALRDSRERLASELAAITRLHQVSMRLVETTDPASLLMDIVDAAIALTAAQMGNVQLLDHHSGALKIVANRGFDTPFLEFFNAVHDGEAACGNAIASGERVIIEDVTASPVFLGTPALDVLLTAGVRAVQSTPLRSRSGRLVGVLSTHYYAPCRPADRDLRLLDLLARQAADAIERMQAEEVLRESAREAERAKADAESANRSKDEFLATLSHELRTPLNSIFGWTRMLRAGTLDAEAVQRALEVVERNVNHQSRLITDLLDVSRIISGKLTVEMAVVDMIVIVAGVVEAMRPVADAKSITVTSGLTAGAVPVVGDAERLRQVVANLLSNALKFTPTGGRVTLQLVRVENRTRLTISDTGKGISAAFMPHIFERFRQGESSSTRAQAGLGLGLAIVRHIVELHGGTVQATSEGDGKGASFTVDLPLALSDGAPPSDGVSEGQTSGDVTTLLNGVRILIAEDDADSRELLAAILTQRGAKVTAAATAREALQVFGQTPPDVLVSDLAMPGDDGLVLIQEIRSRPSDDGGTVPALALTAYARVEDRDRALGAGFQLYMSKPVEPRALVEAVSRLARRA